MEHLRLRDRNLSWREIDEEILVLDLEAAAYISVQGAGRTLWPLLVTGATRSQLVTALTAKYEIDDEVAVRDVDLFVADLKERGLIDQH